MSVIVFELSTEMEPYREDISKFVELMIHKLHKNVHKGRWEDVKAMKAYDLLVDEAIELLEAIQCNAKDEIFLECADVANFAMIIASITRERNDPDIR
jgi:NTP pyrophosphatase (non-canonical NTP hydrolase)